MKPGIDNKPFEIIFKEKLPIDWAIITHSSGTVEVIEKPKKAWFKDILYYLSLGLYDSTGI